LGGVSKDEADPSRGAARRLAKPRHMLESGGTARQHVSGKRFACSPPVWHHQPVLTLTATGACAVVRAEN
jgi:hypothetical protein